MAGVQGFIRIAASGSRRGYSASKRSQAAQIAAQNGMRFLGFMGSCYLLPAQHNYKPIRLGQGRMPTIAGNRLQIVGA